VKTKRGIRYGWLALLGAIALGATLMTCNGCAPALVRADEMRQRDQWLKDRLLKVKPPKAKAQAGAIPPPRTGLLPFAFAYAEQPSADLLSAWPRKHHSKGLESHRTQHTLTWTDPQTHLEVRCEAVEYSDFPVVEWTVYFRNTGKQDAPILASIQGLDAWIERAPEGEFLLHHYRGDTSRADLYEPLERKLAPGFTERFAPVGGRGSNHAFPYYNLQTPDGGLILAVGWPGQWATTFARDADLGLRITSGQERTHLRLKPGQEVRTPLIAMLFWQGDDVQRAQNLWRRWMLAHNVPRTSDGKLPPPILHGNTSLQFNEMVNANEENQKHFLDRYEQERIGIDFWWMDAGWYPCKDWPQTGTWEPDANRFPRGLRAISDHARKKGVRTLVWFEPERVAGGTWLSQNHPKWLLGGTLLNLGDPQARAWLTDHVDRVLREQ
jgi:alpha-galactosidase